MNNAIKTTLDLLKKKQISRDVARTLLESFQDLPESQAVTKDRRIAIIGIAAELPGAKSFAASVQTLGPEFDNREPILGTGLRLNLDLMRVSGFGT